MVDAAFRIHPKKRKEDRHMLEHPQITWILETGYPSWLQPGKEGENDGLEEIER